MINLEQIKILAQIINEMSFATDKIETAYNEKNSDDFIRYKKEILEAQKKISMITR